MRNVSITTRARIVVVIAAVTVGLFGATAAYAEGGTTTPAPAATPTPSASASQSQPWG